MVTSNALYELVRHAWSPVAAPPIDDLDMMEWKWGKSAAQAFTGIAPVDVDTDSPGFHAATPLMDLPPNAAAAYLGTYLLSLLQSLMLQESVGIYDDIVTRPHTLTCLTSLGFWDRVIRPHLPAPCLQATTEVARYLTTKHVELPLTPAQVLALREAAHLPMT
jgi:hypothetical protein